MTIIISSICNVFHGIYVHKSIGEPDITGNSSQLSRDSRHFYGCVYFQYRVVAWEEKKKKNTAKAVRSLVRLTNFKFFMRGVTDFEVILSDTVSFL